jgi:uncharacterized protein (TIGR03083 family)
MNPPDRAGTPVTADDIDVSLEVALAALGHGLAKDWDVPAGDLTWSCRATAEHIASDLVAYSGQLTGRAQTGYIPFDVTLDRDADPAGTVAVIRATGGILSAVVRTAPPDIEVWHPYGMADASAVTAMGIVELLVHTDDICRGLGLAWEPPDAVCARVLSRLFPDVRQGSSPWGTLLWATGRTALPDRPRLDSWRWYNHRQF